MKKILPIILLLLSLKNYSQLVLTQSAYEPVVGDTSRAYVLDTTAYTNGLMTNQTGANFVWNYQALNTTTALITTPYVSTAAVASSSMYPGSTFVQSQNGLNSFFKSVTTPTTQTEFMGLYSTGISMNFTNTAIIAKYPMAYGNTVTDPFSGSFTFSTTSGNATGNATTTADGTGTLNLPAGITFTNVLRVKSIQNINMTVGGFPAGTVKQLTYSFYAGAEKFPILNINYTSVALTLQNPTVTASASGHKNYFVVGIKENSLSDAILSVYPNPATEAISLIISESLKPSTVEIINQLGQKVYRGSYQQNIQVGNLPAGIYFIEIKTDKGVARKKFIKE